MSENVAPASQAPASGGRGRQWWRAAIPLAVIVIIAVLPPPHGLAQHAWYFFAIFSGVVAALVLEPLPNAAIGIIAISVSAALAPWVLLSPAELANPSVNMVSVAANWALSGFSSTTVWLIGGAFMFAMGYEKTGLGRRIALTLVSKLGRNSLSLAYANSFAEALLAIVTPSNSARGAGAMFPMVSNLPPLYGSKPNDPSSRLIGGYIMYTAFAANTITSSLFLTGCAPNFLALEFARKLAKVDVSWAEWFMASAPFTVPLLLLMPLIVFVLYPPKIKRSPEAAVWATQQLRDMGRISRQEIILAVIVVCAVLLWILGDKWMDGSIVALLAVSFMFMTRLFTWNDLARNHAAWTSVIMLATLVTMASGLARVGFIKWFADFAAAHVGGLAPTPTIMVLVAIYFVSHYMFASLTAHTTAMFPIMLGVGLAMPGLPARELVLALALCTGIMGVISPYATGPAPVYYNSGYIKPFDFWRLGFVLGAIFLASLLFIGIPMMMLRG